jgi:hypothetical protein
MVKFRHSLVRAFACCRRTARARPVTSRITFVACSQTCGPTAAVTNRVEYYKPTRMHGTALKGPSIFKLGEHHSKIAYAAEDCQEL